MEIQNHEENPLSNDLTSKAEEILLEVFRQSPEVHFTVRRIGESPYAHIARKKLGFSRGDHPDLAPIFVKAAKAINRRFKSFMVEFSMKEWSRSSGNFHYDLRDKSEWSDALEEAWQGVERRTEHLLSDAAARLLDLAKTDQLPNGLTRERALTTKIGLGARDNCLGKYLREIVYKTGTEIRWEKEKKSWREQAKFRIWLPPINRNCSRDGNGLENPRFEINFSDYKKSDVDAVKAQFYGEILKAAPTGNALVYLVRISTYRELRNCFSKPEQFNVSDFIEFLGSVRFSSEVTLCYDFRDWAPCWFVALKPKTDWPAALDSIRNEMSQPSLEQRLGMSAEAAKLMAWIDTLGPEELLGSYSPIVEEDCEKRIGIDLPWEEDNFGAYIGMLIEEINDKTDYDLRIQPWHDYSRTRHRIMIRRKKAELEDVLARLQCMAARNGASFDREKVRSVLDSLVHASRSET